jgi:Ca-activated chloride channel family protein
VNTPFGRQLVYQRVDLNEGALKDIAAVTGGRYYLASDTGGLAKIYGTIDSLEKREVKVKEFFHYRELYPFFLIPGLILICLELALKATVLRVLP